MKKLLFIPLLLLAACNVPVSTSRTSNNVSVDLLFTHEGCKVYRFNDMVEDYEDFYQETWLE